MRKIIWLLIILCLVGVYVYLLKPRIQLPQLIKKDRIKIDLNKLTPTVAIVNEKKTAVKITKTSVFVPYWTLDSFHPTGVTGSEDKKYDRYIYFGITADYQGINQQEVGFLKLPDFLEASAGKEALLTLRLLNDDFNKDLLKNEVLQQKIIQQTTRLVKEKNFSGLVLDLELFSLFDNGTSDQISEFVKKFYTSLKSDYKMFGVTIYGDNFFRHRPFDIITISENCDEILVMAYDFHKSRGEPGPNFPLARRSGSEGGQETQTYDYDFKTMIKNFTKIVPSEKLTIIFGMFGYNWTVDEKKRPFAQAKALTLKEIQNKFIVSSVDSNISNAPDKDNLKKIKCSIDNCLIEKDEVSSETEINYTVSSNIPDEQGVYRIDYHIIWFEDEESAAVKSQYLKENGIGSIGYWAWGYF